MMREGYEHGRWMCGLMVVKAMAVKLVGEDHCYDLARDD